MTPKKLGTLAEKLELSNALRKQYQRQLADEQVEHGKTKAFVQELEHKIKEMEGRIRYLEALGLTKGERKQISQDQTLMSLRAVNKNLREREKSWIQNRNELLRQIKTLEKR